MKKQIKSPLPIIEQLVDEVDKISKRYADHFTESADIKALQGMERCVELKMKIRGIDGKPPPQTEPVTAPPEWSIPVVDLPSDLLEKLINHLKTKKMQQQ